MPGSADVWGEKVRWFHTISEISEKGPAKIRHLGQITPNLEAMPYIIIENNYSKWPCFWRIKTNHKDEQGLGYGSRVLDIDQIWDVVQKVYSKLPKDTIGSINLERFFIRLARYFDRNGYYSSTRPG